MEKFGRARHDRDENITSRMRFACWITNATDTQSEYETIKLLLFQWLRERALMLRYKYTACLVHIRILTDGPIFLTGISASCRAISATSIRLIVSETIYLNHVGREPIYYLTSPYSRGTAPIPIEWVGPIAGLDDLEKRNLLILPRIEFRVVRSTAYHYCDHIIPTLSIDDTRKLSI